MDFSKSTTVHQIQIREVDKPTAVITYSNIENSGISFGTAMYTATFSVEQTKELIKELQKIVEHKEKV